MVKSLLLLIWLWVASVVALDHPEAQQQRQHDVLQKDPTRTLAEGDPWPVGTHVYREFDGGFYQGEITAHSDSDGYTITWSTGNVDVNKWDDDEVDQMVEEYQTMFGDDAWPVGTNVYWEFDDGWYQGEITAHSYSDGYTITWSNGDVNEWDNDEVDQMVEEYQTMFGDDPWPVGTMLYWEFDDGWYNGSITAYNASDGGYTITWSDGEVDVNEWDDDAVDEMVENYMILGANDGGDDPWPVGTMVYWEFEDEWYQGEITRYNSDSGLYSILWANGDTDVDGWNEEDVDQMVQDYQTMVANDGGSSSGMSASAVFVIVAVSLVAFMGIVCCVCVRYKKKKTMQELRVMSHHYRTGDQEII